MIRRLADPAALILGLLALWQLAYFLVGHDALSPPLTTFVKLGSMLATSGFWADIAETGEAFLAALVIAIGAGIVLGLLIGLHRFAGEVAEPFLLAGNAIPKIALYPIVLLVFGIGMPAKIAFGAIHGIVPVMVFTAGGCRTIAPVLLRTARAMRLRPRDAITRVVIPAALPEIFTGIRIGVALTLIGTILGEMFGSQRGLGFLLMRAIGLQSTQVIMAVTLLLVIFAATISTALLTIDRRLHRR